jgi:hypothetical protein
MKKTLLLLLMVAAVVALTVSGAWATDYQFQHTGTDMYVESYHLGNPLGQWQLVLADSGDNNFNIAGANLVNSTLEIFTGWPGSDANDLGAIAADLTLKNNNNTYMVRLYDSTELGYLFENPSSISTSNDVFNTDKSVNYGGAYDENAPKFVPVWANDGQVLDENNNPVIVTVNWKTGEVDIDLSTIPGFDFSDGFSFLYPSATCANSVLTGELGPTGNVPLPPSALLLGTGLLGLVGLGWRRKRAS